MVVSTPREIANLEGEFKALIGVTKGRAAKRRIVGPPSQGRVALIRIYASQAATQWGPRISCESARLAEDDVRASLTASGVQWRLYERSATGN
jgi:hypothetical protein